MTKKVTFCYLRYPGDLLSYQDLNNSCKFHFDLKLLLGEILC